MSQMYMLDTNMASYLLKGKSQAVRVRMESLRPGAVCLSSITEAELLYGVAKSGAGEQRRRFLDWLLSLVPVYPWGRQEAAVYGWLRAKQEALGKTLGPLDMQIAAHAIALGAVLVTHDKAFQYVAGFAEIEDWAIDL